MIIRFLFATLPVTARALWNGSHNPNNIYDLHLYNHWGDNRTLFRDRQTSPNFCLMRYSILISGMLGLLILFHSIRFLNGNTEPTSFRVHKCFHMAVYHTLFLHYTLAILLSRSASDLTLNQHLSSLSIAPTCPSA